MYFLVKRGAEILIFHLPYTWQKIKVCVYVCNSESGEKKYTGTLGNFTPEMHKGAFENQNRATENSHRLQCKSLKFIQYCRFRQWDVKSSPRKLKYKKLYCFPVLSVGSIKLRQHNEEWLLTEL